MSLGATPNEKLLVAPRAYGRRLASEVRDLLHCSPDALVAAYLNVNQQADASALRKLIAEGASDFRMSGVDLMPMRHADGRIHFCVLEINSAPGFAYCTPGVDAWNYAYKPCIAALLDAIPKHEWQAVALLTESKIAVETSGFTLCLQATTGHPHWLIVPPELERAERQRCESGTLLIVDGRPLRGGLRYLHLKPWRWLPPDAQGHFLNGTAIDLRGGRNKVAAQRAFDTFNSEWISHGIKIIMPKSYVVENSDDLERVISILDGWAVSKIPDGNSGIGIEFFNPAEARYQNWPPFPFLIQEMLMPPALATAGAPALVGAAIGRERYAFDLRVVIVSTREGYHPLALYGRRARAPLATVSRRGSDFRAALDAVLKVNISVPNADGGFHLEMDRLLLADDEGWHAMGLSSTAALEAITQAILATSAVDRYGRFDHHLDKDIPAERLTAGLSQRTRSP
jgi:hypothetical protein